MPKDQGFNLASTMGEPSFGDLPPETLSTILSFCPTSSLIALARVSTILGHISTEKLYSNLTVSSIRLRQKPIPLLHLAYLVFKFPKHASCVRSINVRGAAFGLFTIPTVASNMDAVPPLLKDGIPEWEELLKNKCREYTINSGEADSVFRMLDGGKDQDAVLALVLASLPKLERLRFENIDWGSFLRDTGTHTNFGRVVETIARQARICKNPFRTPLDITVAGDTRPILDRTHLEPFFHMPHLRSIFASNIRTTNRGIQSMDMPFSNLQPQSCPITQIELRRSSIHHHNLQRLLNATTPGKLKVFKYEVNLLEFENYDQFERGIQDTIKGFEAHYDTLEVLTITRCLLWGLMKLAMSEDPEEMEPPRDFCALSFVRFRVLRQLDITPMFIWGPDFYQFDSDDETRCREKDPARLWKALPETLEELRIREADGRDMNRWDLNDEDTLKHVIKYMPRYILPALTLVMENKPTAFRLLRKLDIQSPQPIWEARWGYALDVFLSGMEAIGVCCSFIDEDFL
jgi:hypothetical protein